MASHNHAPCLSLRVLMFVPVLLALVLGGCDVQASAHYKPPFVPVLFVVDSHGNISIQADASVATPIGEFGADVGVGSQPQPPDGGLLMMIKRLLNGKLSNAGFDVNEDASEKVVIIDNSVTLRFTGNLLGIDATGHHKILLTTPQGGTPGVASSAKPPTATPQPTSTPLPSPTPEWRDGTGGHLVVGPDTSYGNDARGCNYYSPGNPYTPYPFIEISNDGSLPLEFKSWTDSNTYFAGSPSGYLFPGDSTSDRIDGQPSPAQGIIHLHVHSSGGDTTVTLQPC